MDFDHVKPVRVIVLVVFAFLALLALFLFANFKGFNNGQAAIGTVDIWGTLPDQAMHSTLDALRSAHPEYANISYEQKPVETFGSDLAEALAVGNGPDLVIISQEQLDSQQNKLSVIPYSSISQRSFLDSYLPINELYLTDKGTYGIPFVVDPLVMYYNRTELASAGVAQAPTTWEAVLGLAGNLNARNGGTITHSLLAFGGYENIPNARGILSLLLLQAGSPLTQVSGSGKLEGALMQGATTADGTNPADSALSFYTQFSDPAKTVYSWNGALPDARQAFLSGDLALYFGYASELPTLRAGNPNIDFDMAPVPQPARSTTRMTYGLGYALAIPKTAKNPTGAFSTAVALAASDIAPNAARQLSMAPALRASLIPAAQDRYEPVFYPEALVAKGWLSPSPSVTDSIFAAMITNITSGRKTIRDALATANQALTSAL